MQTLSLRQKTNSMKIYGIIGYPLGHSCSPSWFNKRFREEGIDAEYLPFEIEDIGRVRDLLVTYPDLQGFNVTIPHKQNILPFLDEISEEARAIGAVTVSYTHLTLPTNSLV